MGPDTDLSVGSGGEQRLIPEEPTVRLSAPLRCHLKLIPSFPLVYCAELGYLQYVLPHIIDMTETDLCVHSELANDRLVNDVVPLRDACRLRMGIPTKRTNQHRLQSAWLPYSGPHQQISRYI